MHSTKTYRNEPLTLKHVCAVVAISKQQTKRAMDGLIRARVARAALFSALPGGGAMPWSVFTVFWT